MGLGLGLVRCSNTFSCDDPVHLFESLRTFSIFWALIGGFEVVQRTSKSRNWDS